MCFVHVYYFGLRFLWIHSTFSPLAVSRGVTHGGDGGGRVPPKVWVRGDTVYSVPPPKKKNIMVKYHAPTKTEQGKLNCYPLKIVSWSFLWTSEENLYKFGKTYRYIIKYFKYLFVIYKALIYLWKWKINLFPYIFFLSRMLNFKHFLGGSQHPPPPPPHPPCWTGSLRLPPTPLSPSTFWN